MRGQRGGGGFWGTTSKQIKRAGIYYALNMGYRSICQRGTG